MEFLSLLKFVLCSNVMAFVSPDHSVLIHLLNEKWDIFRYETAISLIDHLLYLFHRKLLQKLYRIFHTLQVAGWVFDLTIIYSRNLRHSHSAFTCERIWFWFFIHNWIMVSKTLTYHSWSSLSFSLPPPSTLLCKLRSIVVLRYWEHLPSFCCNSLTSCNSIDSIELSSESTELRYNCLILSLFVLVSLVQFNVFTVQVRPWFISLTAHLLYLRIHLGNVACHIFGLIDKTAFYAHHFLLNSSSLIVISGCLRLLRLIVHILHDVWV